MQRNHARLPQAIILVPYTIKNTQSVTFGWFHQNGSNQPFCKAYPTPTISRTTAQHNAGLRGQLPPAWPVRPFALEDYETSCSLVIELQPHRKPSPTHPIPDTHHYIHLHPEPVNLAIRANLYISTPPNSIYQPVSLTSRELRQTWRSTSTTTTRSRL